MILLISAPAYGKRGADPRLVTVSGYVQFLYAHDFRDQARPGSEFEIRRGRLKFRGAVNDALRGIFEIDGGGGELTVKDIGIEYRAGRAVVLFLGQNKMPFSREQQRPASDLLVIDRGLLNDVFDDLGYLGRDLGITISGDIGPVNRPVRYAAGVYNGSGAIGQDTDDEKQFVQRLEFGPVGGAEIGLNSTQRSDPLTHDAMIAYGGDFLLRRGRLTVEGEALAGKSGFGATMAGGNLTGAYRIGTIQPAVKFERLYPDVQDTGEHSSVINGAIGWFDNQWLRVQAGLTRSWSAGGEAGYEACAQVQLEF